MLEGAKYLGYSRVSCSLMIFDEKKSTDSAIHKRKPEQNSGNKQLEK